MVQRVLRYRHLIAAVVWVALILPTIMWWQDSVLWVAFLSLYANIAAEVAAHHALQAEKNGD